MTEGNRDAVSTAYHSFGFGRGFVIGRGFLMIGDPKKFWGCRPSGQQQEKLLARKAEVSTFTKIAAADKNE